MKKNLSAFTWGGMIGVLGGLIGLGGAEFRLPVLVGIFRLQALTAIVVNLVISLVTVIFSFVFRSGLIHLNEVLAHAPVIFDILAGSLTGAYLGVGFATRLDERTLRRIVTIFLVFLSAVLIGHVFISQLQNLNVPTPINLVLGFIAGIVIGIFSSMLGVAGGELIIPTILLLFSVDIKLAGSLSLAISIPTVLMGLIKYRTTPQGEEIHIHDPLVVYMASGSIIGALAGSTLLRFVHSSFLHVLLGVILLISALKLSGNTEERKQTAPA